MIEHDRRIELEVDDEPPEVDGESGDLIEPATARDLARVAEIDRLAFPDPWGEAELLREIAREHARVEVLRREPGGEILGFINYWLVVDEVQLLKVGTAPDHLRRGIGRQLVLGMIASACMLEMAKVTLEVRASNAPAIALYGSLGFEQVGRRPRYYPDGEDALLMDLSL